MLNSFEELCIMQMAAKNSFARVLNPPWGSIYKSTTSYLFISTETSIDTGSTIIPLKRVIFSFKTLFNHIVTIMRYAFLLMENKGLHTVLVRRLLGNFLCCHTMSGVDVNSTTEEPETSYQLPNIMSC